MGKHKPMNDFQYAKMYGIGGPDMSGTGRPGNWYDDEGNDDQEAQAKFKAEIRGHQANNYDMRRTHEMLQDDDFRRHMKQQGFKGVDRMVKRDNMPSSAMLTALQDWGGKIGTHNNKGTFDTRDLGATFKSFAKEHSSHHNERMETMMDDRMASLKKSLQDSARDTKPADEARNYELSDELSGAQMRLDDGTYDFDAFGNNQKPGKSNESAYQSGTVAENPDQAFNHSNNNVTTDDVAEHSTGSYLESYKADLKKAGRFGPSPNNLSNAINTLNAGIG